MIKSMCDDKRRLFCTFPKLMIHENTGVIVLFTKDKTGFVVHFDGERSGNIYRVGLHSDDWRIDEFIDYDGVITLVNSND